MMLRILALVPRLRLMLSSHSSTCTAIPFFDTRQGVFAPAWNDPVCKVVFVTPLGGVRLASGFVVKNPFVDGVFILRLVRRGAVLAASQRRRSSWIRYEFRNCGFSFCPVARAIRSKKTVWFAASNVAFFFNGQLRVAVILFRFRNKPGGSKRILRLRR